MADGRMYVGKADELVYEWWGLEAADKPSAVSVQITRVNNGVTEYLQANDTWSTTGASRTATNTVSTGKRSEWRLAFTPLASMQGYAIQAEAIPTAPVELGPLTIDVYVTTADEDALKAEHDTTQSQVQTLQGDFDAFEATNQGEHDATQAKVQALQDDFDTFEVTNQAEHDATQSAISTIGAAAESALYGPKEMTVPESGTKTYRLYFILKDLDVNPVALVDPDNNRVTVNVQDQVGGAPTGITLSDGDGVTAGSQMARDGAGEYHMDVTIADSATVDTQVRFRAEYAQGGVTNIALYTARLVDIDPQLARIEANTNTLLTRIGESGDAATVATIFGRIKDVDTDLTAHETNRATMETTLVAEHDATQAELGNATYGLAALNTDLDAVLARVGMDAGGYSLHQKLGAFTDVQTLKALLGGFTDAENLKAVLGAYSAASSLKGALDGLRTDLETPGSTIDQAITDAVWDDPVANHLTSGTTGRTLKDASVNSDPARVADAVWDEGRTDHATPGTFGETAGTYLKETRDAIAHSTYGLAALNVDLDSLLARLGVDASDMTVHQKLGAFTATENLKAILGDLSTTKRLGQSLGAFTESNNLKALLGAFTVLDNLKALLGTLTAAENLKKVLDDHEVARNADAETIKADAAAARADIEAHRDEVEPELDQILVDTTTDIPTAIAAHDDAVLGLLQDASTGLSAIKTLVDTLLGRLGETADVGGTNAAGTAMAKLNKALEEHAAGAPADVEWAGVEPV